MCPPSLTRPHLPPPPPTTPRLSSPSPAQWTQGPGCGWSPSRKEVGVLQEEAATAAAHLWVWSGDTCTSRTPPRTSPLCLFPLRVSWLRVSRLLCPFSCLNHDIPHPICHFCIVLLYLFAGVTLRGVHESQEHYKYSTAAATNFDLNNFLCIHKSLFVFNISISS